ncbi:MAG: DUF6527 family protein [Bacillota bacterium]
MKIQRKPALLRFGYKLLKSLGFFRGVRRSGVKRAQISIEPVDDKPESHRDGVLYLIGEGNEYWAAQMRCPCGCGDVIDLNLMESIRPRWTVSEEWDGSITLHPSIWRNRGCRSHFFVRSGQVQWC